MAKFKVGDRVMCTGRTACGGFVPGATYTVSGVNESYEGGGIDVEVDSRGRKNGWAAKFFELVASTPVRTITRREIVPGWSGKVNILDVDDDFVRMGVCRSGFAPSELREAARIFNEIADVLEENGRVEA